MKIALVAKRSKYEWESERLGLTHSQMEEKYSSEHANFTAILGSHARQLRARTVLEKELGVKSATLDEFKDHLFRTCIPDSPFSFARPDLIIVLGGDNSFCAVAPRAYDVPVMAINSDPQLSVGYLTRWRVDQDAGLEQVLSALENKTYAIEEWTRLENSLLSVPAISELYLGETKRKDMSRMVIEHDGDSMEVKCSGLVVATGAGSTGWYHSANVAGTLEDNKFAPTEPFAKFVITEPYRGKKPPLYTTGKFYADQELVVHSLNDDGGLISTDSWWEHPFTRGMTATIKIGKPAKIVVP